MQTSTENKALHFFDLSFQYLALVENVCNETIKSNNEHLILSDQRLKSGEYEERTKWSDFNIIIPVLYNFYHGLELLMKGLLLVSNTEFKADHKLSSLLKKLESRNEISHKLKTLLSLHINTETIPTWHMQSFLRENAISTDQLYEAFRYPTNYKFSNIYEYIDLRYREDDIIPYLKEIINDSKELRLEAEQLYRKEMNKKKELGTF